MQEGNQSETTVWTQAEPPGIKWSGEAGKVGAVPEGVWTKCPACGEVLYAEDLGRELLVCPKCAHHMRIGARRRLEAFLDAEGREELARGVASVDALGFVDSKPYPERLEAARAKTGEEDALVVMAGAVLGVPVVAAAFEFAFMGGSMGAALGEKFARAVAAAIERRCAFVCFAASGGARMQEGVFSLMQLCKTNQAVSDLSDARLPFISVLTDPTMGGVSASFAFLGDLVIAEPGALIGFAGPRVIEQTVRQSLPEGFQRAEFLLAKGAVDMIVDRRQMRSRIAAEIRKLMKLPEQQGEE